MADKAIDIKGELRRFIIASYLLDNDGGRLSDDDSFLDQGIIDSIGVIELTGHIQRVYDIKIKVPEIVPANFDTLNRLERYITRKIQGKAR